MKKYSDSRWNNTTLPKVIGKRELTEEEKEREKEFTEQFKKILEEKYDKKNIQKTKGK